MDGDLTPTNVNAEAVQDMLEERVRRGRTPIEAAGEVLWLADLYVNQKLLSGRTQNEMNQVVSEWLMSTINLSTDEIRPYQMMAAEYARFLAQRARIDTTRNAMAMIDDGW